MENRNLNKIYAKLSRYAIRRVSTWLYKESTPYTVSRMSYSHDLILTSEFEKFENNSHLGLGGCRELARLIADRVAGVSFPRNIESGQLARANVRGLLIAIIYVGCAQKERLARL